jgi:hypothetical protein
MPSSVRMYRPAPDFPLRSAESSNICYDALDGQRLQLWQDQQVP